MVDRQATGLGIASWCVAIVAGLVLATLPFWPYVHFGVGEPHVDHAPRHGGQLGMVGDHHLEVARRGGNVEVFVTDAWRRSVRPQNAWVVFDGSQQVALTWQNHRLITTDRAAAHEIEAIAVLADGTRLAMSFDFSVSEGDR